LHRNRNARAADEGRCSTGAILRSHVLIPSIKRRGPHRALQSNLRRRLRPRFNQVVRVDLGLQTLRISELRSASPDLAETGERPRYEPGTTSPRKLPMNGGFKCWTTSSVPPRRLQPCPLLLRCHCACRFRGRRLRAHQSQNDVAAPPMATRPQSVTQEMRTRPRRRPAKHFCSLSGSAPNHSTAKLGENLQRPGKSRLTGPSHPSDYEIL
jgi:hypothetical protein